MRRPDLHSQKGVALIVVLIFLIVIALLGISVATVTNMEERQAGNTRDRDLAFQAAEAALTDAQTHLTQSSGPYCNDARVHTYAANDNSPSYWAGRFASPCNDCFTPTPTLPTGAGQISQQPQYLIDKRASDTASPHARRYVVTARAVGGTSDAVVILQAQYTCDDFSCTTCTP